MGLVDVVRPDGGCKAIRRVVGQRQDFAFFVERDDRQNRTKDFFLCNRHGWQHVVEQRRCQVVAATVDQAALTATPQSGTVALSAFDIATNAGQLFLTDDGSQTCVRVQGIAWNQAAGGRDDLVHELILDFSINDQP
ncbi:hypothetical protein D3C71_1550270 [compost metagenome]